MPPTFATMMRSKSCGSVDATHGAERQLARSLVNTAAGNFDVLRGKAARTCSTFRL